MKNATSRKLFRPFFLLTAMLIPFLLVGLTPTLSIAQSSDDEEMEMEEDYGDDDDYYSGGASGRNKAGAQDLASAYQSDVLSKLGNIDIASLLMPSTLIEVDDSPILKKEAEQAFLAGNQPLALEFMFAYMVAEYEKAAVDLQLVKYSPVLRRPVWQTRFGVSLAIRGADEFVDPQPIREGKTPGGRMAARGPRGLEDGTEEDYRDDLDEMDSRPPMNSRMDMNQAMNNAFAGGGNRSMSNSVSNAPTTSMLSEDAEQELDKALGLVAEIVGEEFRKRYQQGDFGPALANVAPPPAPLAPAHGMGMRAPVGPPRPAFTQEISDALADSAEPLPMWRPGIVYLGQGDSKDIIPMAKAEGIDFLLHFDVFLKQGRTDWVQNVSRCRIIQVSNAKALGVSKGIDSGEAMRLVQSGRGDERSYVEEQLENLFMIIDRQIKTIDLPKLSPEVAKKRIASLIASPGGPPSLRTLAEVRLYQAQGLVDEAAVESVFNIVGGEDGLTMLHGPREDRLTTARKWAVQSQNQKKGDAASAF